MRKDTELSTTALIAKTALKQAIRSANEHLTADEIVFAIAHELAQIAYDHDNDSETMRIVYHLDKLHPEYGPRASRRIYTWQDRCLAHGWNPESDNGKRFHDGWSDRGIGRKSSFDTSLAYFKGWTDEPIYGVPD